VSFGGLGLQSINGSKGLRYPHIVAATVAAEDRRFFRHAGIDPVSIVRALKTNLVEGAVAECTTSCGECS